MARALDAGRNRIDLTASKSLRLSVFASASAMAVASCPELGRFEKRYADDIYDRRCGPRAALRDDRCEDRPPGLSLHHRAFRTLRSRGRAGVQLRYALLLSRRSPAQHDGTVALHP